MKKRMTAAVLAALTALSLTATAFAAEGDDLLISPAPTENMPIAPAPEENMPIGPGPVMPNLPSDVAADAWYADAAKYVCQYDLLDMTTATDGTELFLEKGIVNRQTVAETLFRDATLRDVASVDEDAGMSLHEMADIAQVGESYLSAVSFCYYTGIMAGDNNKNLNPTKPISRQELAAVLTRYYRYLVKTDPELESGMAVAEFTDYAAIGAWAHEELQFCINTGLLAGNADGSFNPLGNVTRAQIAQIVYNLEQGFAAKPVEGLKLITAAASAE